MRLFACLMVLMSFSNLVSAEGYETIIRKANVELVDNYYEMNAEFDYNLSRTAKEALSKGIVLTWRVLIKVKREGVFWDSTIYDQELVFKIQNHALLNLYSLQKNSGKTKEMYSSLTSVLSSISKIRDLKLIKKTDIEANQQYYLAVKVFFDREALSVPLRPLSYFDSQWALSSQWMVWPLQN